MRPLQPLILLALLALLVAVWVGPTRPSSPDTPPVVVQTYRPLAPLYVESRAWPPPERASRFPFEPTAVDEWLQATLSSLSDEA